MHFQSDGSKTMSHALSRHTLFFGVSMSSVFQSSADPKLTANQAVLSWGAVLGGAAAAAAFSLILLILGTGLGLSSVSPWSNDGITKTTFGVSTILWITLTQIVASGLGGYLAGRLRGHWEAVHTDEVFFRDTAHGFLAWAVATLVTAALLTSAIGTIVGGTAKAGASVASASVAGSQSSSTDGPTAYFLDSLFRGTAAAGPEGPIKDSSAEVSRIFLNAIQADALAADDTQYVGQLVARRTGLSQADAEKRVTETFSRLKATMAETQSRVKEAANTARKTSAYAALWLFISLLAGAFVASYCATYGGGRRDSSMKF
jgi:hypothetical protein